MEAKFLIRKQLISPLFSKHLVCEFRKEKYHENIGHVRG